MSQIKFEIEHAAHHKIYKALTSFGDYEIGGMLVGYQKDRNHFAIADATVADDIGKFSIFNFIREPIKSMRIVSQLFKKNRFHYIGEWHSHPKFSLTPSSSDIKTMQGILIDRGYGVNFALLIIAKLNNENVNMAGFLFHKSLSSFIPAEISNNSNK